MVRSYYLFRIHQAGVVLSASMTSENPPYTIIGTPFSTFTRTITLGLQYKGLRYNQIATVPHSEVASDYHPFGYLPTLIINKGDDGDRSIHTKLSESQAIVRYLDRIAPEPTLQLGEGSSQVLPEKMWEFVSFAASYGK
jgi:glutathione S-transferase